MSKKIMLGVVGLVLGFGFVIFLPPAHAAGVPAIQKQELSASDRALLGQALSVLQLVLNQVEAKVDTGTIADRPAVNAALGGIKQSLLAISAEFPFAVPMAENPAVIPSGEGYLLGANSPVSAGKTAQLATVSWLVWPKMLLIILPIFILLLLAFVFTRKRKDNEAEATIKNPAKVEAPAPAIAPTQS